MQEEQEVLEVPEFAGTTNNNNNKDDIISSELVTQILQVQREVKGLQKDMYEVQKEHDVFVRETYQMFSESSLLICEAVENCFGNRKISI